MWQKMFSHERQMWRVCFLIKITLMKKIFILLSFALLVTSCGADTNNSAGINSDQNTEVTQNVTSGSTDTAENIPFSTGITEIDSAIRLQDNEDSKTTSLEGIPANDVETGSLSLDF